MMFGSPQCVSPGAPLFMVIKYDKQVSLFVPEKGATVVILVLESIDGFAAAAGQELTPLGNLLPRLATFVGANYTSGQLSSVEVTVAACTIDEGSHRNGTHQRAVAFRFPFVHGADLEPERFNNGQENLWVFSGIYSGKFLSMPFDPVDTEIINHLVSTRGGLVPPPPPPLRQQTYAVPHQQPASYRQQQSTPRQVVLPTRQLSSLSGVQRNGDGAHNHSQQSKKTLLVRPAVSVAPVERSNGGNSCGDTEDTDDKLLVAFTKDMETSCHTRLQQYYAEQYGHEHCEPGRLRELMQLMPADQKKQVGVAREIVKTLHHEVQKRFAEEGKRNGKGVLWPGVEKCGEKTKTKYEKKVYMLGRSFDENGEVVWDEDVLEKITTLMKTDRLFGAVHQFVRMTMANKLAKSTNGTSLGGAAHPTRWMRWENLNAAFVTVCGWQVA